MFRVDIQSASGKVRTGPPKDANKEDFADAEMRDRVWVGTIPVYETLGEPATAEYSLVSKIPREVEDYVEMRNGKEKEWSELVASKKLDLPLRYEDKS